MAGTQRVLIVAPLVLDDIATRTSIVRDVLGGSGAYAALAARHFAPTALASVIGADFPREHLALLADIDLSRVICVPGRSFRWSGVHREDGTTQTRRNDPGATAGVLPELGDVTGAFALVGAHEPALQRRAREALAGARFVAIDTMAWHIARDAPALRGVLRGAQMALLTLEEARALIGKEPRGAAARGRDRGDEADMSEAITGATEVAALAEALLATVDVLVLKAGPAGAYVRTREVELSVPAAHVQTIDPTGAGDAFAGAFLATLAERDGRLDAETLRLAAVRGTAAAALAVSDFGTRGLARATRKEVEEVAAALPGAGAPVWARGPSAGVHA